MGLFSSYTSPLLLSGSKRLPQLALCHPRGTEGVRPMKIYTKILAGDDRDDACREAIKQHCTHMFFNGRLYRVSYSITEMPGYDSLRTWLENRPNPNGQSYIEVV
jgi:hypothetical protein